MTSYLVVFLILFVAAFVYLCAVMQRERQRGRTLTRDGKRSFEEHRRVIREKRNWRKWTGKGGR